VADFWALPLGFADRWLQRMETLLASTVAFASANLAAIIILALFFGDKAYRPRHIMLGQL
jgi:cadmium resistance protein CadD (predicted permease)